jgi:hypothetical protein
MTRRLCPILVMLVTAGILIGIVALASASPHADCGEERAAVKLGRDVDARKIALDPVTVTIAELVLRSAPRPLPGSRRVTDERNTERTVYTIHATITGYRLELDGDYHVVISDEHGQTMIVELPDPGCAATGAWPEQIRTARVAFRQLLADHRLASPAAKLRSVAVEVVVTGVGFYDRVHGQTGVARNGVELHPVLAIEAGGGQ